MLLWLKAVHIMAVISWMAGMLYLPRLFVYHAEAKPGSETAQTFMVMERRLLRGIMNPAMIAVWITGPWLAWQFNFWRDPWLHAKFALVVLLTVFHHLLGLWRKAFAAGEIPHDARFFRIVNELPALLMVGIVILVVVKPW